MTGTSSIVAVLGVALVLVAGCSPPPGAPAVATVRPPLPPGTYPEGPLAVGAAAPAFAAAGWLNGAPPEPGAAGAKIVVLDIWAVWCLASRQSSPALVQLSRKYKGRGVAFVSLTAESRERAERFAGENVPWPHGYGAELEDLAQWGAYSASRMSATYNPGYEVSPTLYVLGADRRVLWCDGQARPRHTADPAEVVRRLDVAIEAALAETTGAP